MISANISNKTRKAVYAREGYCCAICGNTKYLQIHHCIPRSRGGSSTEQNLVCLCADCHALTHGISLQDYVDQTQETAQQAILEYLADYYAPDWQPEGL